MSRLPHLSLTPFLLLAAALSIGYLTFTTLHYVVHNYQVHHDETSVRADIAQLDREHGQLVALRDYLKSDEYVEEVARLWRADAGPATAETLDRAIGHIIELRRSDGSFGVWSDSGDTVPWLDAYATDFLIRAKEHGKNVPDFAIKAAVSWLHDYTRQDHPEIGDLPALACAHYVLARAKSGDLDALRYFYETQMARLPTKLAKAQTAAALAQYGDVARAAAAYDAALVPGHDIDAR